jgi:hypothetical protein
MSLIVARLRGKSLNPREACSLAQRLGWIAVAGDIDRLSGL